MVMASHRTASLYLCSRVASFPGEPRFWNVATTHVGVTHTVMPAFGQNSCFKVLTAFAQTAFGQNCGVCFKIWGVSRLCVCLQLCVLCVLCVLCLQDIWCVSSRCLGPLDPSLSSSGPPGQPPSAGRPLRQTAPPLDGPYPGPPKISLSFFFSPRQKFHSFWRGLLIEFWCF